MSDPAPSTMDVPFEPKPGPSHAADEPVPSEPIVGKTTATKSVAMLEAENYLLKLQIERQEELLKTISVKFTFARICEKDELILEYTGLPTRGIFENLLFLIENEEINYYAQWKIQKIYLADQLLLTLMKLRQNFSHTDLAFRFNIALGTVTNIVVTFIHLLYDSL